MIKTPCIVEQVGLEDISLHIMDIVENSICAGAKRVKIQIIEDKHKDLLIVEISDDGKGMTEEIIKDALDPFFTTKTVHQVGLGLPLLAQSAKEAEGELRIVSKQGKGTKVTATFKYSHVDRKPLGNMTETMVVLIAGNPCVDFLYKHKKDRLDYSLDTRRIKVELENVPIDHPEVIKAIQKAFDKGERVIKDAKINHRGFEKD